MKNVCAIFAVALLLSVAAFAQGDREGSRLVEPMVGLRGNVDCAFRAVKPKRFSIIFSKGERFVYIATASNSTQYLYSPTTIVRCGDDQTIPCARLSEAHDLRNAHRFLERTLRREAYQSKSWKCPLASSQVRSAFDSEGWVTPSRF